MSSSQPSPTSLLDRAEGRSLSSIWKQGLGAWMLTVSTSAILGVQAIVELFFLTPLDAFTRIINMSVTAVILEPLSVIITGSDTTAEAIRETSILGLPISVIIVLGSLFMVSMYLREPETSDSFVGSFTDFIGGTDEEGEDV